MDDGRGLSVNTVRFVTVWRPFVRSNIVPEYRMSTLDETGQIKMRELANLIACM